MTSHDQGEGLCDVIIKEPNLISIFASLMSQNCQIQAIHFFCIVELFVRIFDGFHGLGMTLTLAAIRPFLS